MNVNPQSYWRDWLKITATLLVAAVILTWYQFLPLHEERNHEMIVARIAQYNDQQRWEDAQSNLLIRPEVIDAIENYAGVHFYSEELPGYIDDDPIVRIHSSMPWAPLTVILDDDLRRDLANAGFDNLDAIPKRRRMSKHGASTSAPREDGA